MINKDLWIKISNFDFDALGSFKTKLQKQYGWNSDFINVAIEEYKKFLYLSVVAGPVTPCEVVDYVWHTHLIFTKSYWQDLCKDILGTELHHNPGTNNPNEEAKFKEQFKETILAYQKEFGIPPSYVWNSNGSDRLYIEHMQTPKNNFLNKLFSLFSTDKIKKERDYLKNRGIINDTKESNNYSDNDLLFMYWILTISDNTTNYNNDYTSSTIDNTTQDNNYISSCTTKSSCDTSHSDTTSTTTSSSCWGSSCGSSSSSCSSSSCGSSCGSSCSSCSSCSS